MYWSVPCNMYSLIYYMIYISTIMHMVCNLLWWDTGLFSPFSLGLLHWHWGSHMIIPPPNEVGGGVYWNHHVCLFVCPSVCRRHGFRSVTQVCFWISIWNFIYILLVAMGRSLLVFSNVTFKMAAWRPSWNFQFPFSNFCLALNIKTKLQ